MNIIYVLLGVVAGGYVSDQYHMEKCFISVRTFVAENESVDELIKQANNDMDVVLIYLLRMCYFHQPRKLGKYSLDSVYASVTSPVASFAAYEFDLFNAVITKEAHDHLLKKSSNEPVILESVNDPSVSSWSWGVLLTTAVLVATIARRKRGL